MHLHFRIRDGRCNYGTPLRDLFGHGSLGRVRSPSCLGPLIFQRSRVQFQAMPFVDVEFFKILSTWRFPVISPWSPYLQGVPPVP